MNPDQSIADTENRIQPPQLSNMSRRKQQNPKSVVHADAELAFKESTKSAENSDILSASSPRGTTDKDNPGRGGESPDGDDCSRPGTPASRASVSSSAASPSINLVEDDDEAENDGDAGRGETAALPAVAIDVTMPRLRLNVTLASDPALQPYARDIKLDVGGGPAANGEEPPRPPIARTAAAGRNEPRLDVGSDDDEAPRTLVIDVREMVPPETAAETVIKPKTFVDDGHDDDDDDDAIMVMPALARPTPPKPPAVAFVCEPCGIKFSSLSTLEAHQTYYCSHATSKEAVPEPPEAKSAVGGRKAAGRSNSINHVASIAWETAGQTPMVQQKEPPAIRSATGRLYACGQCSYSADKKVSLNRHMRIHQTSPQIVLKGGVASDGELPLVQSLADCHCIDCDIRFSSLKTYRAHKEHYCSARRRDSSGTVLSVSADTPVNHSRSQSPHEVTSSPTSPTLQHPPQPYLALPTNPIVIIPYSLIRGASVLPGPMSSISPQNIANPDHTCFILANGLMQPIAQSLALPLMSPPLGQAVGASPSPTPRLKSSASVGSSTTTARRTPSVTSSVVAVESISDTESMSAADVVVTTSMRSDTLSTTPLDLSVRAYPADLSARSRVRSTSSHSSSHTGRSSDPRSFDAVSTSAIHPSLISDQHDSLEPERIICAPSLPPSPAAHVGPPSPLSATSSMLYGLVTAHRSLNLSPPAAVGCLYGSSHQQYMLRQLLPTDMMSRLVETNAPADRSAVFGTRRASTTAATRTRRSAAAAATAASAANVAMPPNAAQIIVKRGVSKCKECNIVFCKYENYLAHKKHYCSARHQLPQPAVDEAAVDDEPQQPLQLPTRSPPIPANKIAPHSTTSASSAHLISAYQQVICAACGIKFTSLDNLNAHQMYYCPKRTDAGAPMTTVAAAVPTAKPTAAPSVEQTPRRPAQNYANHQQNNNHHHHHHHHQYKCPLCDVVSPNAGDAKRHLDTHAGVKAFRCSICRYRGNTMRGMRTHIRMHFDRKSASADFNEEDYITCVLEENGVEVAHGGGGSKSVATVMHTCDECSYQSMYRGNVIRHTKLVHASAMGYARSPSPLNGIGEGGESLYLNAVSESNAYSVNFKAERLLEQLHHHRERSDEPAESTAKRIKLEQLDDETTNSSSASSSSTATTAPMFYKQHAAQLHQQPLPLTLRRKSAVSVN